MEQLLEEIYRHALETIPNECCGLVIVIKGKYNYIKCTNILHSSDNFIIDGKEYASAEDLGEILYIVHSHPKSLPEPSHTDLIGIEKASIPWIIVNPYSKTYTITNPSGFQLPLIGRAFHHGVIDCYSLIRDYYKQVLNITLPEFEHPDLWWQQGLDLYEENFRIAGFEVVKDIQPHDVLLMRVGSSKSNHGAVYIGNNKIVHHPMGRLSTEDIYGGWWQKITSKVIRYKGL